MESRGGWRVKVVGEWRGVGRRVVQSEEEGSRELRGGVESGGSGE